MRTVPPCRSGKILHRNTNDLGWLFTSWFRARPAKPFDSLVDIIHPEIRHPIFKTDFFKQQVCICLVAGWYFPDRNRLTEAIGKAHREPRDPLIKSVVSKALSISSPYLIDPVENKGVAHMPAGYTLGNAHAIPRRSMPCLYPLVDQARIENLRGISYSRDDCSIWAGQGGNHQLGHRVAFKGASVPAGGVFLEKAPPPVQSWAGGAHKGLQAICPMVFQKRFNASAKSTEPIMKSARNGFQTTSSPAPRNRMD